MTQATNIQSSNNEARRSVTDNAVSINKQKVSSDKIINKEDLLNNQYTLCR
ncbi:MAG: hypothetical protein IPK03_15800 [Bacteroidetes bacterium]|nr:hypothetical protein [Bacteroidota bacterium]